MYTHGYYHKSEGEEWENAIQKVLSQTTVNLRAAGYAPPPTIRPKYVNDMKGFSTQPSTPTLWRRGYTSTSRFSPSPKVYTSPNKNTKAFNFDFVRTGLGSTTTPSVVLQGSTSSTVAGAADLEERICAKFETSSQAMVNVILMELEKRDEAIRQRIDAIRQDTEASINVQQKSIMNVISNIDVVKVRGDGLQHEMRSIQDGEERRRSEEQQRIKNFEFSLERFSKAIETMQAKLTHPLEDITLSTWVNEVLPSEVSRHVHTVASNLDNKIECFSNQIEASHKSQLAVLKVERASADESIGRSLKEMSRWQGRLNDRVDSIGAEVEAFSSKLRECTISERIERMVEPCLVKNDIEISHLRSRLHEFMKEAHSDREKGNELLVQRLEKVVQVFESRFHETVPPLQKLVGEMRNRLESWEKDHDRGLLVISEKLAGEVDGKVHELHEAIINDLAGLNAQLGEMKEEQQALKDDHADQHKRGELVIERVKESVLALESRFRDTVLPLEGLVREMQNRLEGMRNNLQKSHERGLLDMGGKIEELQVATINDMASLGARLTELKGEQQVLKDAHADRNNQDELAARRLEKAVQALESRFHDTVFPLQKSVGEIPKRLEGLRSDLEESRDKGFNEMSGKVADMDRKIEELQVAIINDLASLGARLEEVKDDQKALKDAHDKHELAGEKVEKVMQALESRFHDTLTPLKESVTEIQKRLEGIRSDLHENHDRRLLEVSERLAAEVDGKINWLQEAVISDIGSLNVRLAKVKDEQQVLREAHDNRGKEDETGVERVQKAVHALESRFRDTVLPLENLVGEMKNRLEGIRSDLQESSDQRLLNVCEKLAVEVDAKFKWLQEAANNDISALEVRLAKLKGNQDKERMGMDERLKGIATSVCCELLPSLSDALQNTFDSEIGPIKQRMDEIDSFNARIRATELQDKIIEAEKNVEGPDYVRDQKIETLQTKLQQRFERLEGKVQAAIKGNLEHHNTDQGPPGGDAASLNHQDPVHPSTRINFQPKAKTVAFLEPFSSIFAPPVSLPLPPAQPAMTVDLTENLIESEELDDLSIQSEQGMDAQHSLPHYSPEPTRKGAGSTKDPETLDEMQTRPPKKGGFYDSKYADRARSSIPEFSYFVRNIDVDIALLTHRNKVHDNSKRSCQEPSGLLVPQPLPRAETSTSSHDHPSMDSRSPTMSIDLTVLAEDDEDAYMPAGENFLSTKGDSPETRDGGCLDNGGLDGVLRTHPAIQGSETTGHEQEPSDLTAPQPLVETTEKTGMPFDRRNVDSASPTVSLDLTNLSEDEEDVCIDVGKTLSVSKDTNLGGQDGQCMEKRVAGEEEHTMRHDDSVIHESIDLTCDTSSDCSGPEGVNEHNGMTGELSILQDQCIDNQEEENYGSDFDVEEDPEETPASGETMELGWKTSLDLGGDERFDQERQYNGGNNCSKEGLDPSTSRFEDGNSPNAELAIREGEINLLDAGRECWVEVHAKEEKAVAGDKYHTEDEEYGDGSIEDSIDFNFRGEDEEEGSGEGGYYHGWSTRSERSRLESIEEEQSDSEVASTQDAEECFEATTRDSPNGISNPSAEVAIEPDLVIDPKTIEGIASALIDRIELEVINGDDEIEKLTPMDKSPPGGIESFIQGIVADVNDFYASDGNEENNFAEDDFASARKSMDLTIASQSDDGSWFLSLAEEDPSSFYENGQMEDGDPQEHYNFKEEAEFDVVPKSNGGQETSSSEDSKDPSESSFLEPSSQLEEHENSVTSISHSPSTGGENDKGGSHDQDEYYHDARGQIEFPSGVENPTAALADQELLMTDVWIEESSREISVRYGKDGVSKEYIDRSFTAHVVMTDRAPDHGEQQEKVGAHTSSKESMVKQQIRGELKGSEGLDEVLDASTSFQDETYGKESKNKVDGESCGSEHGVEAVGAVSAEDRCGVPKIEEGGVHIPIRTDFDLLPSNKVGLCEGLESIQRSGHLREHEAAYDEALVQYGSNEMLGRKEKTQDAIGRQEVQRKEHDSSFQLSDSMVYAHEGHTSSSLWSSTPTRAKVGTRSYAGKSLDLRERIEVDPEDFSSAWTEPKRVGATEHAEVLQLEESLVSSIERVNSLNKDNAKSVYVMKGGKEPKVLGEDEFLDDCSTLEDCSDEEGPDSLEKSTGSTTVQAYTICCWVKRGSADLHPFMHKMQMDLDAEASAIRERVPSLDQDWEECSPEPSEFEEKENRSHAVSDELDASIAPTADGAPAEENKENKAPAPPPISPISQKIQRAGANRAARIEPYEYSTVLLTTGDLDNANQGNACLTPLGSHSDAPTAEPATQPGLIGEEEPSFSGRFLQFLVNL